jgi:hypothetical protein
MLLVLLSYVFYQLSPLSDVLQAESWDLASTLQLASSLSQILVEQRVFMTNCGQLLRRLQQTTE